MKKKSLLLLPTLVGLLLCGCNSNGNSQENPTSKEPDPTSSVSPTSSVIPPAPSSSSTPAITSASSVIPPAPSSSSEILPPEPKQDFVGVEFASATYPYDGLPHNLGEVTGAPDGTSIIYTGRNSYTNIGTYNASALLSKEGYNDKTLYATLTISKGTFTGLTFESKTVTYDGDEHITDVQLIGTLPQGTTVVTTVKDSDNNTVTSAVNVGTYTYTCVVSNPNYTTLNLNATLTIKAQKRNMPVFIDDEGTAYFANGLHNNYLYSLSGEGFNLIDYSSPKEFNRYSSSSALFIAGSTLLNSVKQVSGGTSSVLYTDSNIDDFVKQSDSIYYYSSNSLKATKSGIYKVDATDSNNEPVITKLFTGKSDNLALYGGYLYFINGNDHNYLYKLNLSNNQVTLVMEEKVHEYLINNNKLYCSVNGTLNDYIGYINLSGSSTEPTKLTNASGEFLTIKDGYLYYNYTDLWSMVDQSKKGIWKISISGGDPVQLLENDGISGFDVESSTSLLYVDTTNLHLYRYNTSSKEKVDLLDGFVAPESTPINTGGQTISLGSKTYYLNMYAGKTLYCYDESLEMNSQLTTNKVEDFYIYNGVMYFNQVTMLTNNDLYSVNLTSGGEAEKLCSNDMRNMVSDGTYLYATHYNWAGTAGGMSRMKLDGSEYVKFSDVNGAKNLKIRDGKLYYINCETGKDHGDIEFLSLSDITPTSSKMSGTNLSNKIDNVKQFEFDGDNIFYAYDGTLENSIRRTDFTTLAAGTKIASSKTNPNHFVLNGDYVYYYSYVSTSLDDSGFYRVSKTATGDGPKELLVGYDSQYYGSNLSISDAGNLYFLNYINLLPTPKGDAHFYQIKLSTNTVTKIS